MDKEAIMRTMNEGEIYRFINKPWRNEDIHKIIAEAALASEFAVSESSMAEENNIEQAHQDTASSLESLFHSQAGEDQGILMMGGDQELRNQIRHLCRQHAIKIYGTKSIPQAVGVVSARPAIGVTIIELPVKTDEAMLTINMLKEKRPELISIVLTDETDAETAVELINSGQVFRYLAKPLSTDMLEKTIEQAFLRHYSLLSNKSAKQRYKVERSTRSITSGIKELFSSFGLLGKSH